MRIYNESNKIEGICRYDEAGNVIQSFDKRLVGRYTREKRNSLLLKDLIKNDLSIENNKYRNKRGVIIAPNISKKFEER